MKETEKVFTISSHRNVLDTTISLLRFSGLWVSHDKPVTIWENAYKSYNKFVILVICIFAVGVFGDLCSEYNDLVIVTDNGCILAGISIIIFKICNFHARSERIRAIIDTVHNPVVALSRSSDEKVRKLVQTCSFYENILLQGFSVVGATLSVALLFLVPVEEGELPIRARYPFDVRSFPMHQIAFFLQACAVIIGLISIISMDNIVIGLYKWTNIQLIILNSNYKTCLQSKNKRATILTEETLGYITECPINQSGCKITRFIPFNDTETRGNNEDSFVRRFKCCVKHHQRIVYCIDELNDIFSVSMFVQVFASFVMICLTGFQAVAGAKNLSSLLKFGVYLGAAFSQLLYWCWEGNALRYQSASLATSQWLSGWENEYSTQVISLMIISLACSKKPLSLRAGKFFTMSMETFIVILRSSYSFFALLTQMDEAK